MTEPRPTWMTPPVVTDKQIRKIRRTLLLLMEHGYGMLIVTVNKGELEFIIPAPSESFDEEVEEK